MAAMLIHDFFCTQCGNKGISLPRKKGHQHKSGHKKNLYCIHCRQEVNHIECKTQADVIQFKEDFQKGVYADESKKSVSSVRNSCFW